MLSTSENIIKINKEFNEYINNEYNYWYIQGRNGKEYTGRTFMGYYGWYWGNKEYINTR